MLQPRDTYNLDRFLVAQENTYAAIKSEMSFGRKVGHWMWFAFPQVEGLGLSPSSQKYAICSLDEARSYLQHPILGARLIELTGLVVTGNNCLDASDIFGFTDAKKFRSSMTLFSKVADREEVFQVALNMFFGGKDDELTVSWMSQQE